jgi:hypothetical protein
MTIRCRQAGCELQRSSPHYEEIYCHRRDASRETSSSFAPNNRRKRNMTWNRTRWLFCRLAVGLSMIAVAAGHAETAPIDLEEDFFYPVQSSDQTFGESSRPEMDRSLQFTNTDGAPTQPPFSFPPIPRPTFRPTLAPVPMPCK